MLIVNIRQFFSQLIDLIMKGINEITKIINNNLLLKKCVNIALMILIVFMLIRFIMKIFSYFTE